MLKHLSKIKESFCSKWRSQPEPIKFLSYCFLILSGVDILLYFGNQSGLNNLTDRLSFLQTLLTAFIFAPTLYLLVKQIVQINSVPRLVISFEQKSDDYAHKIFPAVIPETAKVKSAVVSLLNKGNISDSAFTIRVFIPLDFVSKEDEIHISNTQGNLGSLSKKPTQNMFLVTYMSNGHVVASPNNGLELLILLIPVVDSKKYSKKYPIRCVVTGSNGLSSEVTQNMIMY